MSAAAEPARRRRGRSRRDPTMVAAFRLPVALMRCLDEFIAASRPRVERSAVVVAAVEDWLAGHGRTAAKVAAPDAPGQEQTEGEG